MLAMLAKLAFTHTAMRTCYLPSMGTFRTCFAHFAASAFCCMRMFRINPTHTTTARSYHCPIMGTFRTFCCTRLCHVRVKA